MLIVSGGYLYANIISFPFLFCSFYYLYCKGSHFLIIIVNYGIWETLVCKGEKSPLSWICFSFQVTVSSVSDYQIVFEGVAGTSYQGDIAIDDVILLDNACPPPGDCNFETGMCTWVNVAQKDDFDWVRYNGETSSLGTGPSTDHTTKTKGGE